MKRYSGFKILSVDDQAANLYALRSLVEQHMDIEIIDAQSGQQAIDIALETPDLDLIILDIQMPEMDGFQTASMLKIRKKTRDIPIIFLTAAFRSEEFRQKGYDVGAVDYLLKPIDDNLFLNKISTYFRLIEKERGLNRALELKVAERTAELAKANQYLQSVLQTMGEALLILDPQGKIESANPAACQMLGYSEQQLIGMAIGDVFEEDSDDQASAFLGTWLEAVIRSGAIKDVEARFMTADSKRLPILFSRTAILGNDGKAEHIVCVAKDMSGYQKQSK